MNNLINNEIKINDNDNRNVNNNTNKIINALRLYFIIITCWWLIRYENYDVKPLEYFTFAVYDRGKEFSEWVFKEDVLMLNEYGNKNYVKNNNNIIYTCMNINGACKLFIKININLIIY